MKTKTTKKAIAKLLLAAVVFTTAAPYKVVWAAPAVLYPGSLREGNNPEKGINLKFIGEGIGTEYNRHMKYIPGALDIAIGVGTGVGNAKYLPFYDASGFNDRLEMEILPTGASTAQKQANLLFAQDADSSVSGDQPGYLYGYRIAEWNEGDYTSARVSYGMTQVPNSKREFRATIDKVGTVQKIFRMGNGLFDDAATTGTVEAFNGHPAANDENLRKLLTPQSIKKPYTFGAVTKYEDTLYDLEGTGNISQVYDVGQVFQKSADEIPGFTADNADVLYTKYWDTEDSTTSGYGKILKDPITDPEVLKYIPGSMDYNGDTKQYTVVTGNTHAQLTHRYRWNTNYNVQLTTRNEVHLDLNRDGVSDNNTVVPGSLRTDQTSVKFGVQTTAKPNAAYKTIAPKATEPRYILDKKQPYTIQFAGTGEKYVGNGFIKATVGSNQFVMDQNRNKKKLGSPASYVDFNNSNLTDPAIISELDGASAYFTEGSSAGGDLNHELSFYMPNSNLTVTYHWVKNPNYTSSVRVYYKNNSVNLLNDVKDFLQAQSINVVALGDAQYANANVREFLDTDTNQKGIEYVICYDAFGNVDTSVHPGNVLKVYAPKLDRYLNPNMEQTSSTNNPITEGYTPLMNSWNIADAVETYTINLAADPGKAYFDVNYAPDDMAQVEFLYEVENGTILGPNGLNYERSAANLFQTPYDLNVNPHIIFKSDRITTNSPETYSVILNKDASGKILSFFDPVPDLGYEFLEWVWDTKAQTQVNYEAVPNFTGSLTFSEIRHGDTANRGHAIVRVKPVFKKVDSMWGNYKFVVDTSKLSYTGNEELQLLLNTNGSTPANDVTWADIATQMDFATNLLMNSGVTGTIKWIDLTDNRTMNDADVMPGGSDVRTFKAVVEPAATTTVPYDVDATGHMGSDGVTSIQIDEANNPVTSAFRYIVTDENGKILANVTGAQIMANAGVIPSSLVQGGLTPGYKYKVYSAPITASTADIPAIGGNVGNAAPNVLSNPSADIIIPTDNITLTASLDPNPANVDRLRISVSPTTEHTAYQLIGPDGSVVETRTPAVTGMPVVFSNIVQGGVYTVVPISTLNPNVSSGNGTALTIDTDTADISVPYKLIISTDTAPELVQVDGQTVTLPAPVDGKYILEDVFKDSNITIVLEQLGLVNPYYPLSSVDFSRAVTGLNVSGGRRTHSFIMPQGDLIVTANYLPNGAVVASNSNAVYLDTFDGDSDADGSGFPGFVGEPLYVDPNSPYVYRLHVIKTAADAGHVQMVQETDTGRTFEGLFSVKAQVEYKRIGDTQWSVYDGDVNPIVMILATDIISADRTKVYGMYEIGTNAVPVAGVDDEEFHKPNYTNAFTVNGIRNNTEYVFGYFDTTRYPITIKSNRTQTVMTTHAQDGTTYQDMLISFADYQRQLAHEIALPEVDVNGITWTFKGLSTSSASFAAPNLSRSITQSDILYLYFENDAVQREDTARELARLLADATPFTTDDRFLQIDRNALQNQISASLGVLNRSHLRKSTTRELQDAIFALRTILDGLRRRPVTTSLPLPSSTPTGTSTSFVGVSSGGGGGGGARIVDARKTIADKRDFITVGTHGNWQLIDEKNHTWIFVLNDNRRVKGWNRIGYTYEGKTRVDWYYFDSEGIMLDGWFYDEQDGHWYYLNEKHDGFFGHLTLGWHHDPQDRKWYYLDPISGAMHTGWDYIDREWYFLNPTAPAQTYFYSDVENKWIYNKSIKTRPLGSMYESENTPDGYRVNVSGAWVR